MTDVWIDEVKEVTLKELSKILIDYNSSVSLEFIRIPDQIFDQVKIIRLYQETIQNKKDTIRLHKKVCCTVNCKINVNGYYSADRNDPTSAYLSDAKTFLYMLRLLKPDCYLRFEIWQSNDCTMYKEKGINQETLISKIMSKDSVEKFSITDNQIHDKKYEGIPHMFRYNKPAVQQCKQSEVIIA